LVRLIRADVMKTYLTVWFNTNGERTSEVTSRLMSMGFRPVKGKHDYAYDWQKNASVDEAISLADQVHSTLRGCNVTFKLETA